MNNGYAPKSKKMNTRLSQEVLDQVRTHKYATPYMITDLSVIGRQSALFKDLLPQVSIFYALKSYDHPRVIRYIDNKVSGYDVASVGEIKKLLAEGVQPDRMLFSNPVKSVNAILRAHKLGVNSFAFQSSNELEKIAKYAPEANVYIRLRIDKGSKSFSFAVSNEKFGASVTDAVALMKQAKQLDLNPIGISFHVGSQMSDSDAWSGAIEECYVVAKQLDKEKITISTINIGGGFPVYYGESQPGCSIEDIANSINKTIKKCPLPNIKFVAELGRFLTAESSQIVTTVIGTEERIGKDWLFVDISVFHAFMEKFGFNEFPYPIYSLNHISKNLDLPLESYAVTGPTCDSYDTLDTEVMLPKGLRVGNRLIVGSTGSYSLVYASNFNGFNIPKVYFFESSPVSTTFKTDRTKMLANKGKK
jgi:ornithine decarboxylase